MTLIENRESSFSHIKAPEWHNLDRTYRCRVLLLPDEDEGGYTAVIPRLAGVVSEGDTVEEAMRNIQEALHVALEAYLAEKEGRIPWNDCTADDPENSLERWIVVNV